jgi:hypothetical protein
MVENLGRAPWQPEADDQLEFGRLLYGQVFGQGTLEDFVDVGSRAVVEVRKAHSVRHETSIDDQLPDRVDRRPHNFASKFTTSERRLMVI